MTSKGSGRRLNKAMVPRLLCWYDERRRDLPWRKVRDPYAIWISEVMLQQTTVRTVVPYFEKWMKIFPDTGRLAKAPLPRILKVWQGLGYYQRARNLHAAARTIMTRHGGNIPDDFDTLRKIPGFGPYTTAAVLSQAYGVPLPLLDANVRRVMMRILGRKAAPCAKLDREILAELAPLVPRRDPGAFNQALMELGALVCRPSGPLCLLCPLKSLCSAHETGDVNNIPKKKSKSFQTIETAVAVIRKDGKVLIQKRPPTGLLAGLWEFPGGKVEPGETPEEALRREIREELGVNLESFTPMLKIRHAYTTFKVTLHAFDCRIPETLKNIRGRRRWVSVKDLRRYPFPSANAGIVARLEKGES